MRIKKDTLYSFLLVLPSLAAVAIFVYGFIGWTLRVSLSQWTGLLPDYTWVGLQNFVNLFRDPRFFIDIRNTVIFTLVFISGSLIIGMGTAVLLDQNIRAEGFFRSVYLFPLVDEPGHGVAHERFESALQQPGAGLFGEPMAHHARVGHRRHRPARGVADVRLHHGPLSGRAARHS